MINPVTDRLGFIKVVPFEGSYLFGKIPLPGAEQLLPEIRGVSQEVFRDRKHYKSLYSLKDQVGGDVSSDIAESVKVRKGDIIYQVFLAPQPYNFVGTIQTRDKYQRFYDMSIELIVSNPKLFAILCFNGKDPIASLIREFKGAFQSYTSRFEHDKLNDVTLNFENWISALSQRYGVRVIRPRWTFRADYSRAKEIEVRQQATLKKVEIETEADVKTLEDKLRMDRERRQKQFERDEKSKQSEFNRLEKMKYHQNEAYIKLLSRTVDELVTINRERIRDAIDGNGSVKDVLEDTLKLLEVFSSAASENANIVDGMLLTEDMPTETEEVVERETDGLEMNGDLQSHKDVGLSLDSFSNIQHPNPDSSASDV